MRKHVSNVVRKHIGYVRVSSAIQVESGISLDDQEKRLLAHAAARGIVLDEIVHDDGRSGSSLRRRPGMQRVLAMIARGEVATFAVVKLDRAFRSMNDMTTAVAMMQKHACEFISLSDQIDTSTASGKMVFQVLGVFAEFERNLAGERTASALREKRMTGRVYSKQTPYGSRAVGDRLERNATTAPILARIVKHADKGDGPTAIARMLNAEGIASPGGSKWYASSVASVLATQRRAA